MLEITAAATFCATLVDEWVRAGVTDAVICPGSRSTPMALALTESGRLRVHVFHDERAAGFCALGIGLGSGVPAVVLTTSGTAGVELHPAVVEAHHAKVPLLAVTADRPPELRGVGAPQTIDQDHLFGPAVRWFCDPGVPDEDETRHWRSVAARALLETTASVAGRGPVHMNLPFRDPLIGSPAALPPGRAEGGPWHGRGGSVVDAADLDVASLADATAGRRGVLIVGSQIEWPEAVHALAAQLRWPVLADPASGCRLPREATVSHFDALLRIEEFAAAQRPEVVLRLGSLPASRALDDWLTRIGCWQVGAERDGTIFDPGRNLNSVLTVEPSALCEAMVGALREAGDVASPDGWYEAWVHADAEAAAVVRDVLCRHEETTEPAVARDVVAAVPSGGNLVVSSSMPIRDVEWYAAPREELRLFANRGANGIDGVLSTAVGIALVTGAPTVALVGDVAFLHDSNALVGLAERDVPLCIVVVHNDGGGIFDLLPQASLLDRSRFEMLFGTPHGVELAELAAAHGVSSSVATRSSEVAGLVRDAFSSRRSQVVIARTDRRENAALHRELNDAVAEALRR